MENKHNNVRCVAQFQYTQCNPLDTVCLIYLFLYFTISEYSCPDATINGTAVLLVSYIPAYHK